MSEFNYQAKTKEGYVVQGIIDAPNENTAVEILHNKGYVILLLEQVRAAFEYDVGEYFSKPNSRDLATFTRQLATLIDADMPLSEGLRTLARQVEKKSFRKIITEIAEAVEGGSLLSAALEVYPKLFSNFYIKLIQSGEVSAKLHESLNYLADYIERSQAIKSKLRSALAYPAFIVFSLVLVTVIMTTWVLPQLLNIFKESGITDLPITTRILIWITDFANENFLFMSLTTICIIFLGAYFIKTPQGVAWLDNIKIKMPGLGGIIRNLYLARIAESLATLIKAGIPILDSLRITSELVGNLVYKKIINEAEESVKGGGTISAALTRYSEVPPLFSSMVAIGERTGKMDFILDHVSKFYKAESENSVEGISQVLEPALILILGVAVAGLVSGILLPIYNVVAGG